MIRVHITSQVKNSLTLSASIDGQGMAVGIAKFEIGEDNLLRCELVHVEPRARRRGVATAMFDFAESHLGMKNVATKQLTDDSVEFLTARGITIPKDAIIKDYDDWMDAPSNGDFSEEDEESEPDTPPQARRPRM